MTSSSDMKRLNIYLKKTRANLYVAGASNIRLRYKAAHAMSFSVHISMSNLTSVTACPVACHLNNYTINCRSRRP